MVRTKKFSYNKENLSEAIRYYIDNTGMLVSSENSEGGYTTPKPISKLTAFNIAEHVIMDMQKALLDGKEIYFPEIGKITVVVKKAGTKFNNFAVGEVVETTKDVARIKAKTSMELSKKLNSENTNGK